MVNTVQYGVSPVLESMRAREPGLQAPSNLAGSKIKNTHFSPLINSFSEISNIGKRTQYVSCTYSEGKAIKPMNSKLIAKYALLLIKRKPNHCLPVPMSVTNQTPALMLEQNIQTKVSSV